METQCWTCPFWVSHPGLSFCFCFCFFIIWYHKFIFSCSSLLIKSNQLQSRNKQLGYGFLVVFPKPCSHISLLQRYGVIIGCLAYFFGGIALHLKAADMTDVFLTDRTESSHKVMILLLIMPANNCISCITKYLPNLVPIISNQPHFPLWEALIISSACI